MGYSEDNQSLTESPRPRAGRFVLDALFYSRFPGKVRLMNQEPQKARQEPQRARIRRITEEEFPGHVVIFDEDSTRDIRFRIEDRDGTLRSEAFPHEHPSVIEDMTEEALRSYIRRLCGFPN